MATDLSNLEAAKSNLTATLASITLNPKPSYSIDGQSVSWTEYFRLLTDQIEAINRLMQMEAPYIIQSQAY